MEFDNQPLPFDMIPQIKQRLNTFRAKAYPLSDFIGLK